MLTAGAVALPRPQSVSKLRVNARLVELSQFGKTPEGGTHRLAYSEADRRGREYAMKLMREAKLDVVIDAAGNLVGRRPGGDPNLKPLLIGSHIDSVPEGGRRGSRLDRLKSGVIAGTASRGTDQLPSMAFADGAAAGQPETLFLRTPMPSISTSTTSPGFIALVAPGVPV